MRKAVILASLVLAAVLTTLAVAQTQRERFIQVEGPSLRARLDAAVKQARGSAQTPFWVAYAFDVRPGVAVDASFTNFRGTTTTLSDTSIAIGETSGSVAETRNLGVFLLHAAGGNPITRLEVYNLDRQRDYSRYPVYWIGRATNEESLNLLRGLATTSQEQRVPEKAVVAIGLHDDPAVAGLLKEMFRTSPSEKLRNSAVFWLGQIGGEQAFLTDIVRNEQESVKVRKNAAFAIGVGRDVEALTALQSLYGSVTNREVKDQIIFAASINNDSDRGADFLIKVASDEPDMKLKKQAIFWLGQKAGERTLKVLGDVVNSNDAETEVQKQAVFAISQRQADEAVPLLIKIARTHPKAEVRKQAIFWLGQTGDERALAFFKEILSK
jgi:HEAT repeat protein